MFNRKNLAFVTLVAVAVVVALVTALVSGARVSTKAIPSTGVVASANLGVYADSACTQPLTSISWGTVSPGDSITKTLYVKNTGTQPVTLTMSKTNWNPATADGPLGISWDRENSVLSANSVSTATLSMTVSPAVSGVSTFSVDIVISGTR